MTRDQILEAAAQIFGKKGFHAASMQDIASAVNLQKASLYHHVNSKQEILLALLDQALDLLIEHMEGVLGQDVPADIKLRRAMQVYLKTLAENRELSAVLLFEHRSLEDNLRVEHFPRRDRFEKLWRVIIQDGIDVGIFAPMDVAQVTRALLGVMNYTLTWYRVDGALTPLEIADQYADLFIDGLRLRHD